MFGISLKNIGGIYKTSFRDSKFRKLAALGLVMLVISLFAYYFAGIYATDRASNPVTDVVLSNVPVMDTDGLFIYGSLIFVAAAAVLILADPRLIPFTLRSVALFVIIRSFFVSLTHIGPFPAQLFHPSNSLLYRTAFGGDLFFSGHTGLPFLLALIFWNNKPLRYIGIVASVVFAIAALLGHLHYSIDVFAAYFITYSIYHLCVLAFPEDLKYLRTSPVAGAAK